MESSTTEAITTAAVLNPQQAYQGVSLPSITDRNQIVFEDDPPREKKRAGMDVNEQASNENQLIAILY